MPIIRKQLKPSDVYPDDIRYNPSGDKVERLIDGEWVETPESDPRKNNTLPPRITANTRCDAAQSVADALENQIAQITLAIDNTLTLFQIAGLILGLLSFGVFAIFINIALAIADYMFGLGSAAIEAALPPSAYDDLACIFYCHMDENGQITADDMPLIMQDVVDQLGATGGTIINSMLELAGFAGVNGLASVGGSTGSCGGCGCGCANDCTSVVTTYAYNHAAWINHGAYKRYSAGTPVGQFDCFTLVGVPGVMDLVTEKCVTLVTINTNSGCPPATGGTVELFFDGISQGTRGQTQRVGCGATVSATWSFPQGINATQLSFVQTIAPCAAGYGNYLICAKVTTCD